MKNAYNVKMYVKMFINNIYTYMYLYAYVDNVWKNVEIECLQTLSRNVNFLQQMSTSFASHLQFIKNDFVGLFTLVKTFAILSNQTYELTGHLPYSPNLEP